MEDKVQCGKVWVLEVGQKKQKRLWKLGKETIGEVDEYKYLGVWINRQENALNHVRHLMQKASSLYSFVRAAKFWQGKKILRRGSYMEGSV